MMEDIQEEVHGEIEVEAVVHHIDQVAGAADDWEMEEELLVVDVVVAANREDDWVVGLD
jgi:hypothetical protein